MNCADCGLSMAEIKNHVLLKSNIADIQVWDEHIVNWVICAEREIGTFNGLSVKNNVKLTANSDKIALPDDLYQLTDACFGNLPAMYTGVSTYFNRSCNCGNSTNCGCIRWYVNGCYIHTNRTVINCTISYLAIPLDEDGFPYVKTSHLNAIVNYIKYAMLESRYDEGKVPQHVYNTRYANWVRARTAARSNDEMPNDAEMTRLANIWNSKLPVSYRSPNGFDRDYYLVPM